MDGSRGRRDWDFFACRFYTVEIEKRETAKIQGKNEFGEIRIRQAVVEKEGKNQG